MLIFVAGHRPIYGRQILYFQDKVLSKRAAIEAPVMAVSANDNTTQAPNETETNPVDVYRDALHMRDAS
jgi:type IV secretion system protein VirD4